MPIRRKQPKYRMNLLPTPPPEPTGVWRDITSYSQVDSIPRTPRTWEMKVNGDFRIVVTRYTGYPPDMWLMTCRPFWDLVELQPKDVEDAKREAISRLRAKLEDALRVLPVLTQP